MEMTFADFSPVVLLDELRDERCSRYEIVHFSNQTTVHKCEGLVVTIVHITANILEKVI